MTWWTVDINWSTCSMKKVGSIRRSCSMSRLPFCHNFVTIIADKMAVSTRNSRQGTFARPAGWNRRVPRRWRWIWLKAKPETLAQSFWPNSTYLSWVIQMKTKNGVNGMDIVTGDFLLAIQWRIRASFIHGGGGRKCRSLFLLLLLTTFLRLLLEIIPVLVSK